jgi:CheY-like chemotaxis protein
VRTWDEASCAILVVDDNEDNRYVLTRPLKRLGYGDVDVAENGRIALEKLATKPYDLVLLDIMMPEVNGYEVLERIKADEALRHIPVIMISAVDEIDSVVRCITMGAEDYLSKPFNPVLLAARVSTTIEKKKLRDQEVLHLEQLAAQKQRGDDLLHAILPANAVKELIATDHVQPRRFDDVTVLFCDIVDFSPAIATNTHQNRSWRRYRNWLAAWKTLRRATGWRRSKPSATPFSPPPVCSRKSTIRLDRRSAAASRWPS